MSKTSALRSKMMKYVLPGVTGQEQTDGQVISHNGIADNSPAKQPSDSLPKEVELKQKSVVSSRILLVAVCILAASLGAFLACVVVFNVASDMKKKIEYEYKEEHVENGTHVFDPSQHLIMVKSGDVELKSTRNQEGQLRLINGRFENEGRLEVYHNGEWGTICDDKFNLNTAHVACKQLGYPSAIWRKRNAYFGQGAGKPIWLDDVRCTQIANKDNIVTQCSHRPWGRHNCHHREDVSIRCREMENPVAPEIRLVGGDDDTMGTVEIKYNNQWGSICDDRWDNKDATVICRQLGKPFSKALAVTRALYGQSNTGRIWLDSVNCNGDEADIGRCSHATWGRHDCTHYEDAGVVCTDQDPTYNVRLRGGNSALEGRVEVNFFGRWGTVCDDRWDDTDAMVVCRELGYTGMGHKAFHEAEFGRGSGFIVMDEVECEADKMSLAECAFGGWGVHDCISAEDAGVRCVDDGPDTVNPVITCPNDQPETGTGTIYSYSDEGTTISFPAATATDMNDANNPTVPMLSYQVLTTPPGDISMQPMGFFPVGTTTVEATATDDAGNTDTCQFDVTVTKADGASEWDMLSEECGRPHADYDKIPGGGGGNPLDLIIYGDDVTDLRVWPWAAYIGGCGAEIISRNWAITAAHCVFDVDYPTFITVGELVKGQATPDYHRTRTEVFVHPNYNPNTIDNDIALLKLEMPIMMYTDYVRPVCMATTGAEQATYTGTPEPCYVIGWGTTESGRVTNTLQEVTSPLLSLDDCRRLYGDPGLVTDNMICTATRREMPPPRGSCQGDSGGPMMCKHSERGTWDLVGITSWGYGCADARYPDVLGRVSRFRSYIRNTIDENGGP